MVAVEMDMGKIITEIKTKRFFSEYLPPSFSTINEFDPFSVDVKKEPDLIEPLTFNMSRFSEDGKRRIIYIPEYTSYISVVKYMIENDLFRDLIFISADEHSFSPLVMEDGSLIRHENDYNFSLGVGLHTESEDQDDSMSNYIPNVVDKIKRAKGAKGILFLDIANFYRSIYTHLFPCIKLGYEEAEQQFKKYKANNHDPSISEDYKKYLELDKIIRNMNVARTNGILPGVITSQFIAEGLLAQIDRELDAAQFQFVRYVDDYEFFIYDEKDILIVQNTVSSIFGKYFLTINNEKTKYTPFPYYVVESFNKVLSGYPASKADTTDLMLLFNKFFELEQDGTKGAIRFLIKSINDTFVVSDHNLFASYLLNILVNDSRSLVKVCQLMIKRKNAIQFGDIELRLIQKILIQNIESNNHLEVIWLLYLWSRVSSICLPQELLHKIATSDNELAKIILIEEYGPDISKDLGNGKTIKDEIISSARSWLLLYQLFYSDIINKNEFSSRSKISKNLNFYSKLKYEKFSFYNRQSGIRSNEIIEETCDLPF